MFFDIDHDLGFELGNKVNGDTSSTETTRSTDSMDVVLLLQWQIEVNDQTDWLDINSSSQKIGGDQNSSGGYQELGLYSSKFGNCGIIPNGMFKWDCRAYLI